MSKLAARAEVIKLERLLGVEPGGLAFLRDYADGHLRRLREAVYELLFHQEQKLFQRAGRWFVWLPAWLLALVARIVNPVLIARVAGELPTRLMLATIERLPVALLAGVALTLDTRTARDLVLALPIEVTHKGALELAQRGDFVTIGRFVDYVSDDALREVLELLDDEVLLRASFFTESKNRLDRVISMLPNERLHRILLLVQDDSKNQALEVLGILTQVSYGLKRKLGDMVADAPEGVLEALVRAAQKEGLWAEMLPVVATMSPASLCTVVNLPVLLNPAVLESIGTTADEEDLWGMVLPLVEMMDDSIRTAMAQSMARRGGVALQRASYAALVGELWEPLLDIVARMPATRQQEFAGIARGFGEVDPDLFNRITARADAYGFGSQFRVVA